MSSPVGTAPAVATDRAPDRGRSAGFVQGVDGLRAIAALLVIVVHTGVVSGFTYRYPSVGQYFARGEIGVPVFFLISGFLLYRPFVAAAFADAPAPTMGRYLLRRALRILPLYWVVLAATYGFEGWSGMQGVRGLLAHAFFLQVYSSHWTFHGVTQAWTLCDEVLFYLALPLWAAVLRRRRRHMVDRPDPGAVLRRELVALAGLYAAGMLFRLWVGAAAVGPTIIERQWILSWLDLFALGMALAAVACYSAYVGALPRGLRWLSRAGADLLCWAVAAAAFWLVSTRVGLSLLPVFDEPTGKDLAGHALYGLFAVLLLMPAVFGPPRHGLVRRLLANRVLSLIGLISYGVYLWHQLAVAILHKYVPSWRSFASPYPQFAGSILGIALVLASVTYLVVERPGIAMGHRSLLRRREQAARGEAPAA